MSHLDNPDYDGYETMGGYTDGEYNSGMAESSADFGGGITHGENQRYRAEQQARNDQFDRMSEGSGATEDGDDLVQTDYHGSKSGDDDGRYPEKAQLEEAGYRYESALRSCGHGRAQWQLFAAISVGLAADSIEQFVIGFILPSTQQDLCLNEQRTAWLGSIAYLGLCLGALIWGGVADKVGRRHCLLVCLSISAFFSVLSAFSQGFKIFLLCRLGSSLGIGGAVPAAYALYAEFLPREKRAEHLSWLCLSWVVGGVYAAAMAWAVIPNTGWGFRYGSSYEFHAWRVFVVLCALPSVLAATALTFLYESPRWQLRSGLTKAALGTLQKIHEINHSARGDAKTELEADLSAEPQPVDPGLTEINRATDSFVSRVSLRFMTALDEILTGTKLIFDKYRQETIYLGIVWMCLSFAGFGIQTSVPNQIRNLRYAEYNNRTKEIGNTMTPTAIMNDRINITLENIKFLNYKFDNVTFKAEKAQSLRIRHVVFKDCNFTNTNFYNVQTPNTKFEGCRFYNVKFKRTDLRGKADTKFNSCIFNKTEVEASQDCTPQDDDVGGDAAFWEYLVALLGSMSSLPGLVACGFLMGRVGRINMLCGGLFTAMIFSLFLPLSFSAEAALLAILCLFSGLLVPAWSAIHVLTVESFPTDRRATALGIFIALSRAGALLGSLYLVVMPLWAAALLASAALLGAGVTAIKISDTGNRPLL